MLALSKCRNLKELCLGDVNDWYNPNVLGTGGHEGYKRLGYIRSLIKHRQFTL